MATLPCNPSMLVSAVFVFGAGRLSRGWMPGKRGVPFGDDLSRGKHAWQLANLDSVGYSLAPEIECRASCTRRKSDEENCYCGRRAVGIATGARTPSKEIRSHGR